MKFNSADFPIMKRMLVAREEGIYYEMEKNSLADTWDRLLEYYSEKILEEHKEEIEEEELYRILCKARVEAETGRRVYELIDKDVLETHKVKPRSVDRCEFKTYILDSCIRILRKGISELKDGIEKESRVWSKVEGASMPVRLVRGKVQVYVTETEYLVVNEEGDYVYPSDWNAQGVTCKIRYMDVHLECSVLPRNSMDKIEMVKEYFLERSIIQKFIRNDIEIEITPMENPSEREDIICKYVVCHLKRGKSIKEIFEKVNLYLSRKLVDIIVSGSKKCTVLRYSGHVLEDGLPEVFFVLTDNKVVKAMRQQPGKFEIFVNEVPIRSFRNYISREEP
ncbi:uncharacterized protein Eint_090510 [Encephalitozoon intestinalis ATCC 50506]|uniref:Uncharacterized protein n=1 Tax=Encephalitozoon intestinalis (strain ATCC 50506) TaxID=876142 RepID=E0S9B6_ENCIT|nr:uncharacterized protein Eint_090510 [Encephalitozoon intestinalis ATCC 50506]ADM12180.1 hypothetical protein Eint_090510 [Encephalitozoon intestinalis ATCC 50506]UTX45984.1 hypothetical protein GPK93_09g15700 [Encephalitozoon intestinalis]